MAALQLTPSQTVGPFFSIGLTWEGGALVVPEGAEGGFWLRGRGFDGAGAPVPGAVPGAWRGGRGGVSGGAAACSPATARRCPTRSSRPGRPTARAATPTRTTRAGPRAASAASPPPPPTPE